MALFQETIKPDAFRVLSGRNFLRQHQYLKDITELISFNTPAVKLTGEIIRSTNFHLTAGLCDNPGQYRWEPVFINGSKHQPPDHVDISSHIGDLCVFIKDFWDDFDAFDLAAYALWRITWVHPFEDGNGRTANAIAYYILCRKFGYWLPGEKTIPTYWRQNKDNRYYNALADADSREIDHPDSTIELSNLLKRALNNQLISAEL